MALSSYRMKENLEQITAQIEAFTDNGNNLVFIIIFIFCGQFCISFVPCSMFSLFWVSFFFCLWGFCNLCSYNSHCLYPVFLCLMQTKDVIKRLSSLSLNFNVFNLWWSCPNHVWMELKVMLHSTSTSTFRCNFLSWLVCLNCWRWTEYSKGSLHATALYWVLPKA